MADQGYYGQRMAENFGLEGAPVTDPIPREDAFLVGLQLRDFIRSSEPA